MSFLSSIRPLFVPFCVVMMSNGCNCLFSRPSDPGCGGSSEPSDTGCGLSESFPGDGGPDAGCRTAADCGPGLMCVGVGPSGTRICTRVDAGPPPEVFCRLTAECRTGAFCGPERACVVAGSTPEQQPCTATSDCTHGLVCAIDGFARRCVTPGSGDVDDACAEDRDCLAGLRCGDADGSPVCTDPPPASTIPTPWPTVEYWGGARCPAEVDEVRAYFDVPRAAPEDDDFFRLPYPNDVRRTDAGLDLAGHPQPPAGLGVDAVDRYLRASEADLRGFSTNPTVYFRFSRQLAPESLEGALTIVDISPGSPTYGAEVAPEWQLGVDSRFTCQNTLALRPAHGAPLRPATTYAVIVSASVQVDASVGAGPLDRAPDFDAMLAADAPADSALASAYAAYGLLRAYLASGSRDSATVLNAAVFTTQPVDDLVPRLREVVRAAAAPIISAVTVCGGGSVSPCGGASAARACPAVREVEFLEVHGRIALPIFQQGSAPYDDPADGGGIERDADGAPIVARVEQVCFALTVPRTPMPTGGWPLLLFAQGEGESFRAARTSGFGLEVSVSAGAATLAIELPLHGDRAGPATRSEAEHLYNLNNPRAARGNVLQGVADLYALVYFATTYSADAASSGTGQALDFDETRLALYAHSQGATHAALMMPWEPQLQAVVLSGVGGDVGQSLLTRRNPIDLSALLPFGLRDAESPDVLATLRGGEWHPMLGVMQQYFDVVDPVNYARRYASEPPLGDGGRHVFMTYGEGDSYSTEPTMTSLARAAELPVVLPLIRDLGLPTLPPPLSANRVIGAGTRTQGVRQYTPADRDDGHFVSTNNERAREDVLRFLDAALRGETPVIGR